MAVNVAPGPEDMGVVLALLAAQFRGWTVGPAELGAVEAYWASPDGRRRRVHVEPTAGDLAVWLRSAGKPS